MLQLGTDLGSIVAIILLVVIVILVILYFRGVFRERHHYQVRNLPAPTDPNFAFTVACLSDSFITEGEVTGFWVYADQIYEARLNAIRQAQDVIQFETYMMMPGRRADQFAEAWIERAQAGVRVHILVDNYGSQDVPQAYWQRLEQAGVEVRIFNEFSWKDITNHLKRNHRKLLLVDHNLALIGGAGIADDWDGANSKSGCYPWLDYEVAFQGALIPRLKGIFLQHWMDAGGVADFAIDPLKPYPEQEPTVIITPGEDPSYRDSEIRALYQSLINAARSRLWIASPYFLPDPNSRGMLLDARKRGVDVKILTMGKTCDKPFVHYTSRELYHHLLPGGIEIYEYEHSMMHAKAWLVDDQWVSLGSANFDPRSFFKNDELNLSTCEPSLIQQIEAFFDKGFANSYFVNRKDWQRRSWRERFIGQFSLLFFWQL